MLGLEILMSAALKGSVALAVAAGAAWLLRRAALASRLLLNASALATMNSTRARMAAV